MVPKNFLLSNQMIVPHENVLIHKMLSRLSNLYREGMKKHLNIEEDKLSQMFPELDSIIALNGNFLRHLKTRQLDESTGFCIERIGILHHIPSMSNCPSQ